MNAAGFVVFPDCQSAIRLIDRAQCARAILTTPEEVDVWMRARWDGAKALQPTDFALQIVARSGEMGDGGAETFPPS